MLAIALSLLTVTGTGIAMDQGRSIGPAALRAQSAAPALGAEGKIRDRDTEHREDDEHAGEEHGEEGPLSEIHELAGNLLLAFVGMHVTYLLLFKHPLAKFMLFLPLNGKKKPVPPTSA